MSEATVELPVAGMSCTNCARTIELALNSMVGVAATAASGRRIVTISMPAESDTILVARVSSVP